MFDFLKRLFGSKPAAGQLSDTLYVGNLAFSVHANDLRAAFSHYGRVTSAKVVRDRNSRKSKGYGFVTFENVDGARSALSMNGKDFKGRNIRVSFAMKREEEAQ